jgi:hypothetical protein
MTTFPLPPGGALDLLGFSEEGSATVPTFASSMTNRRPKKGSSSRTEKKFG